MDNRKRDFLKNNGTYNAKAKKIKDPLFIGNDFFNPHDLLQVKYEMLRKIKIEGLDVAKVARMFGVSRPSYYKAFLNFQVNGLSGLISKKRGPQKPHKLSDSITQFIQSEMENNKKISHQQLTKSIKRKFGISIHPRSIERNIKSKSSKKKLN